MLTPGLKRDTVIGIFSDSTAVQVAIRKLKSAGFPSDEIAIVVQNDEGGRPINTLVSVRSGVRRYDEAWRIMNGTEPDDRDQWPSIQVPYTPPYVQM
jgi:hypothetical protein